MKARATAPTNCQSKNVWSRNGSSPQLLTLLLLFCLRAGLSIETNLVKDS
jgi:hypothetical protein